MNIKNEINEQFEKTKLPNVNIKANDEKGLFAGFKNTVINNRIRTIGSKKNKIKKNIEFINKLNTIYEKKIMAIRNKFMKKAIKKKIQLQELKQDFKYLVEAQNKKEEVKLWKEPILCLLRDNMEVEYYQDIKTGWFSIPNMRRKRLIYLDTNNCFNMKIFNSDYKVLFHHVNNTFDYPNSPIHDAEKTTAIIELTWAQAKDEQNLENKKKMNFTDILIWIGVAVAIIIGLIYELPYLMNALGLAKEPVQEIIRQPGAIDVNALPVVAGIFFKKFKK
jgi:hypothetical protein